MMRSFNLGPIIKSVLVMSFLLFVDYSTKSEGRTDVTVCLLTLLWICLYWNMLDVFMDKQQDITMDSLKKCYPSIIRFATHFCASHLLAMIILRTGRYITG